MFAKIKTAGLAGIDGYPVEIEAVVRTGLPGFVMTGNISNETREAQARVWNAIKNSRLKPEPRKITVNFSPAFIRKDGTAYDLPIAAAVLCGYGAADHTALKDTAFFGEIGLDGTLKGVRGALSLAFAVRESGCTRLVLPYANAAEAALVEGLDILGCRNLDEVITVMRMLSAGEVPEGVHSSEAEPPEPAAYEIDFSDVRGQRFLKRAAEIAVSGMHNILMSGPAGTGKTMIARCMPTIMPGLTREENIEISKVYSVCGLLPEGQALLSRRPFRNPHHGITEAAFAGGGLKVLPGELSLASGGILFLDEIPLFSKAALECLRTPLEDHSIKVTRRYGSYVFPADFLLAAAMNGCPCGKFPDPSCTCTRSQIQSYMGRISKPLLERIDICAEANPLKVDEIVGRKGKDADAESSAVIRERVERVHALQQERFRAEEFRFNSRMKPADLEKYCALGKTETDFMREMYDRKGLSGRTYHKILRVARTIADMAGSERILQEHLAEAVELRSIEDKIYGKKGGMRI